jgi:hypothetical protein
MLTLNCAGHELPGFSEGFATSTQRPPTPQPHRNPPDPVPDARRARPTATQQPVTRSAKPSNDTSPNNTAATQV